MSRPVPARRTRDRVVRLSTLAATAALAGADALAQPAAIRSATLDPVVVTAARSPQSIADLVADVTVIGPDEIARSGADSLAALLSRQPGIEIVNNGGPGATTGVFIRGANRGQTVVLLDGLRIGSSTVGAASFEAIPLDQIERIEILRGPASSLYGADAIGGVIQIFTRRGGSSLAANASVGYGSYATATGAAGVSGTSGPFRYSLQVGGRRSDGFNAVANPANFSWNPDRDGYEAANATVSASFDWAKDLYHLSYGMVNLPEGKMKSREGTVVDGDDLINSLRDGALEEIAAKGREEAVGDPSAVAEKIALAALHYFHETFGQMARVIVD